MAESPKAIVVAAGANLAIAAAKFVGAAIQSRADSERMAASLGLELPRGETLSAGRRSS